MKLTCETAEGCQAIADGMREFIVPAVEVSVKLAVVMIAATAVWHVYDNRYRTDSDG